ncbi:MAG: hypothetical protein FWG72_01530 [Oscillospiraceae bacterium]|nr:hypothetical protein [Oscillospiraceae bacterium]
MRVTDNMAMLRTPELAADRMRDIRQTGLTTGTLNEIVRETDEDLQQVRDKSEIEDGRVRTDSESEKNAGQEQEQRDKDGKTPDSDGELRRRASEELLNLPVTGKKKLESKRFDIRV